MTDDVLELAGFLVAGWAVARGIEWVYRAHEPQGHEESSSSGWS